MPPLHCNGLEIEFFFIREFTPKDSEIFSIGNGEAFLDLEDPCISSVDLMRNSILRTIDKKRVSPLQIPVGRKKRGAKNLFRDDNPSQPNIEVKFLERKFSSTSSLPESEASFLPALMEKKSLSQNFMSVAKTSDSCNELMTNLSENGFLESSDEHKIGDMESRDRNSPKVFQKLDDFTETKNSGCNNLKLAYRKSSNRILEDCSTYNITCPDVNVKTPTDFPSVIHFPSNEDENCNSSILSSTCNISQTGGNSPDDQMLLCDTFFPKVINGDCDLARKEESIESSAVGRKNITPKGIFRKISSVPVETKEEVISYDNETLNSPPCKKSKKCSKRNKKLKSNGSFSYECPKCGVSYVIASNTGNNGAYCLHCDLCTSVEPEFVKREKLIWNTCRIC